MATILLSAAGAALGASAGTSILGVSATVLGRAAGATLGRVIDSRLLGAGAPAVDAGRIEQFRLTGASEGAPVARVHGRIRVAGQVIWASNFLESVQVSGGGKGTPSTPRVREFSYSVNLAIALCDGEIKGVGRIWADGIEIAAADLSLNVYRGTEDQLPDPTMEAIEGAGQVPAYRGTAYVVIEGLELGRFGNRVPQFTFEVIRTGDGDPADNVRAVALIPGTGEYALATTPVHYDEGQGKVRSANVNSASGEPDFLTSLASLVTEAPGCGATSLVVSWFGSDLRCGRCELRPKVEQTEFDGEGMPWEVSGVTRALADMVPRADGRPVYGGTPSDASVVQAMRALNDAGMAVMFYPFILMDQMAGNGLPDPWGNAAEQPALPWRGRITTSLAPGVAGSPDGTGMAADEVSAFFGAASASDFVLDGERVLYVGPSEFSYRRFILHYATICAVAGGVDSFCIGSEMRSLTQIRGDTGSFPAVQELIALAAEVRSILGPDVKIGYAADWSEYFGYHPQDGSGDVLFHLDPLWADQDIDFVGIDNYMPLSDWRDGTNHADAHWGAVHNVAYLKANIAGGEGFDWYYRNEEAEALQLRTPIQDGAHGEDWVFRYKDIHGWWSNEHHNRIGGVRQASPTEWVPGSKPVWFTELGCPAVDKGTNEPNKFFDPKSSESGLPKYSNGARDDLIQMQYLRAMREFWDDAANNPESSSYPGRMVDVSRMFVWAWDTRPYPQFPGNLAVWGDGQNYARGHWLSGRISSRSLASVVSEICSGFGIEDVDVADLHGVVRGYRLEGGEDARAALQPLLLATGADAVEADGRIVFRNRRGVAETTISEGQLVAPGDDGPFANLRETPSDIPGRVRIGFLVADGDYEIGAEESVFPDAGVSDIAASEAPLVLTRAEARATVERWLSEVRVSRDRVSFSLPPSVRISAGEVIELDANAGAGTFRIDRVEEFGSKLVQAVRVEPSIYERAPDSHQVEQVRPPLAPLPVWAVMMDLPILRGDEVTGAPWIAATSEPWPGETAVFSSLSGDDWKFELSLRRRAMIGTSLNDLTIAMPGVWDRGAPLQVRFSKGTIASIDEATVFAGGNVALIGDLQGNWEIFQFRDAGLVGEGVWELSHRLRGQRGTDAAMPSVWPAGSTVVVLDEALQQIPWTSEQMGLPRQYRVGPATKPVDHPAYRTLTHTATGVGWRPYSPVHCRAVRGPAGDLTVSWIRRTRIDGDSWDGPDVPLGETGEEYVVRVETGGVVRREATVAAPQWTYSAAAQAEDAISPPFTIAVAQISDRIGSGLFGKVDVDV